MSALCINFADREREVCTESILLTTFLILIRSTCFVDSSARVAGTSALSVG